MNKKEIIENCKYEANSAKNRLIHIMSELIEAKAFREAKSLGTIIGKLETWQNK